MNDMYFIIVMMDNYIFIVRRKQQLATTALQSCISSRLLIRTTAADNVTSAAGFPDECSLHAGQVNAGMLSSLLTERERM